MNLHTIESRLHSPFRRSGEFLRQVPDVIDGGWPWRCLSIWRSIQSVPADGDVARADRRFATQERRHSRAPYVPQLAVYKTALRVHSVCYAFPPGDLGCCEDSGNARVSASLFFEVSLTITYSVVLKKREY